LSVILKLLSNETTGKYMVLYTQEENRMDTKLSFKAYAVVGMMLFALFFGAGNLIFPAQLGQYAGSEVWIAIAGFLITGVGLPLLGILAIGYSKSSDLQDLSSRVHPIFGLVFTAAL